MENQILDILLKMQKMQDDILIYQREIRQDIAEMLEIQIKDKKELDAKFEYIKERFNKQHSELMDLNYKLHLLKTLD